MTLMEYLKALKIVCILINILNIKNYYQSKYIQINQVFRWFSKVLPKSALDFEVK